ncbi:hypothetical protein L218DRAFT_169092 [Marasmius fiardii PR-910]|nr:hypothetical protein L218DRAFT_169092 [Marasmius fiardii PR-910]
MRWNHELRDYEIEYKVERTISTTEIHGNTSSRFTVVSYKGQDAKKVWKNDFRQFSENMHAPEMQLFGINRSSIPLLIFYGDLIPLAHVWDRISWFGQAYAGTLAENMGCNGSELWIGPKQGTLLRGICGEAPVANTQRLEQRLDSQQLVPRQR